MAAGSDAVNVNDALVEVVEDAGPDEIVVVGGAVLTVNDRVAGLASTLPAASVARTETLCEPSASAAVVHGLAQLTHEPESTRHWNVEPDSVAEKANVGVLSFVVPVGPELMVVSGAVVSAGAVAVTLIAFIVVAVSPSVSVTVRRTYFVPTSWKVKDIVFPLPSGHCPPVGPSVPSSSHV